MKATVSFPPSANHSLAHSQRIHERAMQTPRKVVASLLVLFLSAWFSPQSIRAQSGAGHAGHSSCVILKRMGPADEVTSHLYSFGLRGKQFQFVEGKLPDGVPFHGRLTDHDVRNLEGRGTEVLVIEPHYTADDLKQAREQCQGMTGANPNQVSEANSKPKQDAEKPAPSSNPLPASNDSQVSLSIDSTPPGAEIDVDENFVGSTPSTVPVALGSHEITVRKKGFTSWTRKMNVTGGNVYLNAELERVSDK